MSGIERPVTVSWGSIFSFLAIFAAGFVAWSGMSERVARIESKAEDAELHKIPSRLASIERSQDEIIKRLDAMDDKKDGD